MEYIDQPYINGKTTEGKIMSDIEWYKANMYPLAGEYPTIKHLSDILPLVEHKKEICLSKDANGYQTLCYNISANDTFDTPHARECRGITFCPQGNIVLRPLHKFFNVGEKQHTRPENVDWTQVHRVFDKRDGSMITAHFDANRKPEILFKSKRSFTSDVARAARGYFDTLKLDDHRKLYNFIRTLSEEFNCTTIWEFTSPQHRIVLGYEKPELKLLHVRNNTTGVYYDVVPLAHAFNIPMVDVIGGDIKDIMQRIMTQENTEGIIIQMKNGDMMKLKSKWYQSLHHNITFLRERDIAMAVIEERVDDIKSALALTKVELVERVEDIEDCVNADINSVRASTEKLRDECMGLSDKEFHMTMVKHPYRHLTDKLRKGRDEQHMFNEYKAFFVKYILKDHYSLRAIEGAWLMNGDEEG